MTFYSVISVSVVRLLGLDRLVFILGVTLLPNGLHKAIQLWLMPRPKRHLPDRIGRIIEALTLTGEHIFMTIDATEPSRLGRQLDTLCIGMDANGVVRGGRETDSWLDCRVDVLVLEELIVLWDSDHRLKVIFGAEHVKTAGIKVSSLVVDHSRVHDRRSQLLLLDDSIRRSLSLSDWSPARLLHVLHCLCMNGHRLLSLLLGSQFGLLL